MHDEKSMPKEQNFSSYALLVPNAWLALMDSKNNTNPCSFKCPFLNLYMENGATH